MSTEFKHHGVAHIEDGVAVIKSVKVEVHYATIEVPVEDIPKLVEILRSYVPDSLVFEVIGSPVEDVPSVSWWRSWRKKK